MRWETIINQGEKYLERAGEWELTKLLRRVGGERSVKTRRDGQEETVRGG